MLYRFKGKRTLQVSLLVSMTIAILCNTFANEFVWDDTTLITENPYIRDYKNIPSFFTIQYWNESYPFHGLYRPVRELSFAVDYFFWELKPLGYHVTNLVLHTINVLLIFCLVSMLAGESAERQVENGADRYIFASLPFLTALFFSAHPVHTESINLIKNRSDLLAFLFFLISLLLFIKHLTANGRILSRLAAIIGSWICFVPAILSKETAVMLPGILVLYAACFLTRLKRKKALLGIVPYGIIILAYFWLRHAFIKPTELASADFPIPAGVGQHALTVIKTMGWYFKMLAVPFPLNAEHTFTFPPSLLEAHALGSMMALLLIGIVAIKAYRHSRIVFFSIGWMILTLLPSANIIYLASRPIAEQRLYIPSFGFCLMLGFGIERLSGVRNNRLHPMPAVIVNWLLTVVIVSLYAGITVHRNFDWRDKITFFSKILTANPDSARAHNNLGVEFEKIKNYKEAIRHYQAALRLRPNYALACNNLASVLSKTGKKQEAFYLFLTALRLNPNLPAAHNNLAEELTREGRFEEAISHYQTALRLQPNNAKAHFKLGFTFYKSGRYEEAISHFMTAISHDPYYTKAYINLGVSLAGTGRLEEAIRYFKIALRLDPDNAETCYNLGAAYAILGNHQEALAFFERSLLINPDNTLVFRAYWESLEIMKSQPVMPGNESIPVPPAVFKKYVPEKY